MTIEETIERALQNALPCKCCKRQPTIQVIPGSLFYAQCDCKRWRDFPYQFLGTTAKSSIDSWNSYQGKEIPEH